MKWAQSNGSRSTPNHHFNLGRMIDDLIGEIETFHIKHCNKEGRWMNSEVEQVYVSNILIYDVIIILIHNSPMITNNMK